MTIIARSDFEPETMEDLTTYLKENADIAQRIENAIRGRTAEVGEALMAGPDDEGGDADVE